MRKKSLILALAALVSAVLLTACTSSDTPEQTNKAGQNGTSSSVQTTGEQTSGSDGSTQKTHQGRILQRNGGSDGAEPDLIRPDSAAGRCFCQRW